MLKLEKIKEIFGKYQDNLPAELIEEVVQNDEPEVEDLSGKVAELEAKISETEAKAKEDLENAKSDYDKRVKAIFFGEKDEDPKEPEKEDETKDDSGDGESLDDEDIYELLYGNTKK